MPLGLLALHAICRPSLDGDNDNGNDTCDTSGRRVFPRASPASAPKGGSGTFQKASVDEAYLEPTRRTLLAELLLPSRREKHKPAAPAPAPAPAPATAKRIATGGVRPPGAEWTRDDECSISGGGQSAAKHPAQQWRCGDADRCAESSYRYRDREGASESQDGGDSGEENGWETSVGYDSLEGDGHSNELVERRRGGGGAGTKKDEEDEEDRLLEAGGLLATKIQQTLPCSLCVWASALAHFYIRR